jgi:hypothetical protein
MSAGVLIRKRFSIVVAPRKVRICSLMVPPGVRSEIQSASKKQFVLAVMFAFSVCTGLSLFLAPALIIRPFRFQSPRALNFAMAVRQQGPAWTLLIGAATVILAAVLWRRVSLWKRVLLGAGVCLVVVSAVMSRVDYFEWMFHPIRVAGFEAADHAKLDSSEMVMAVRFGSDARAYPIRAMAYHHVLNDVVGGVPIAVTY